jgi:hypothetical protein
MFCLFNLPIMSFHMWVNSRKQIIWTRNSKYFDTFLPIRSCLKFSFPFSNTLLSLNFSPYYTNHKFSSKVRLMWDRFVCTDIYLLFFSITMNSIKITFLYEKVVWFLEIWKLRMQSLCFGIVLNSVQSYYDNVYCSLITHEDLDNSDLSKWATKTWAFTRQAVCHNTSLSYRKVFN